MPESQGRIVVFCTPAPRLQLSSMQTFQPNAIAVLVRLFHWTALRQCFSVHLLYTDSNVVRGTWRDSLHCLFVATLLSWRSCVRMFCRSGVCMKRLPPSTVQSIAPPPQR